MAIVKMSKFTLFAFESQKEALLDKFHKFENVQFVNLQENAEEEFNFLMKDSQKEELSEIEGDLAKVKFTLDMLEQYVEKEKGIKALMKGKKSFTYAELNEIGSKASWKDVYEALKEKDEELASLKNEVSKIHSEVELLTPWNKLDCAFGDLKALSSVAYYLGTLPKAFKDNFRESLDREIPYSYIEILSEVKDEINVLIVVHKDYAKVTQDILKSYSFSKANVNYEGIPYEILKGFGERLKELSLREAQTKEEIKSYGKDLEALQIVYEYLANRAMKCEASENFLKTEHIIALRGWLPTNLVEEFKTVITSVTSEDVYMEFEEAELEDGEVPILLKNNKVAKAFESITKMYSLPKYNEVDPTPLLTPFYLVFFGMMLADAGYGVVMFIASVLALKYLNLEESQRDFINFFKYLSIPTFIVGVLYGGYFGDAIKIPGLINPGNDVIKVLIGSMALGLIHLYVGLGIKAYMIIKNGSILDAVYDVLSWYLALTGGLLLLAGGAIGLSPLAISISKYVMFAGMAMIVLTQGRANKNVGARLGAGLYALYGISGYVGDLVSYSRLMALGLAGGFIGGAFNLMIGLLGNGPVKWIFGTLIFVAGHVFNLLLSALGAYVHTCRLQYVEYFGKFYEGGGKPFTPFKSRNKYINIKEN